MFDIGFWEMAFIGAVALIVIGPERLPGVARTAGHWVGKGRRMLNEVKTDIKKEVREQELQELQELKQELGSVASDFRKAADNPDVLGLKETGDQIRESVDDVSSGLKQAGAEIEAASGSGQPQRAVPAGKAGAETRSSKKATKKAASKKATTKKATKKATSKKTASKKTAAKKAPAKKATAKKTTVKKAAPKKTTRKVAAKKAPTRKKTSTKKAATRKTGTVTTATTESVQTTTGQTGNGGY